MEDYSHDSPFLIVEIPSIEDAKRLIQRSILIKHIVELWGHGDSQVEMFDSVRNATQRHRPIYQTCSFKFLVDAFGYSLTMSEQIKRIENCSWLEFPGAIDLKNPDVVFTYLEDYGEPDTSGQKPTYPPKHIYFGVLVGEGNRSIVTTYDLKKRNYLGTTSMDAELSLVMANQALAKPGKLVLDPFVGTGSFLVSCSHFGAYTMGADIDGRQIRGMDGNGIENNINQYNLKSLVLGTLVTDIAHHPWRCRDWFDAIVCDPPYGVRAGAKKIASTNLPPFKKNGERRYPTMEAYEMSLVISDLIQFASIHLVKGGRLVFWLPTLIEEYTPEDIPTHPDMKLIANSEQNFGKWSRRLITMEKISGIIDTVSVSSTVDKPGHSNFREKYFNVPIPQ
ncbi:S-adenosyl-L-methionine-dependent methyltransferase [Globomyces pollinis-pini]|nr:S-adenosyl-L-methionine-dependent methyltransferase [Globomyces pollinis-pini]